MIGTPPPNPLGSHLGLGRSSSGGGDTKKQLVNEGGPDTPRGGNPPSLCWVPRSLVSSSCRYGWWEGMGEENGRREIRVAGKKRVTRIRYTFRTGVGTPHTHTFLGTQGSKPQTFLLLHTQRSCYPLSKPSSAGGPQALFSFSDPGVVYPAPPPWGHRNPDSQYQPFLQSRS